MGFTPHRDANFVKHSEKRSIMTVLLFLNEGFEGGKLNFLQVSPLCHAIFDLLQAHKRPKKNSLVEDELKDGFDLLSSVTPKIGRLVLFDHRALHEGSPRHCLPRLIV